jgi:threonine dehydrogenase-like Zn-dependent dehydrogenase
MCRPRGTVVMKSTVHERVGMDMASVIVPEITLVGSRCGRFEPALALLAGKKIDVLGMIAGGESLRDAARAFGRAQEKGTLKILLRNV